MAHHDLKGHAAGFICFKNGAFAAKSKKQRLNSNSSYEAELIGAGEFKTNHMGQEFYDCPRI